MKKATGTLFLLLAGIVLSGCDTSMCDAALGGGDTCDVLMQDVVEIIIAG